MSPFLVCLPIVDPSLERKTVRSRLLRKTGLIAIGALLSVAIGIAPANATPGLYGPQDATYDGVYRQSLMIVALRAHGQKIPAVASAWLAQQQCPDGGFEPFRAEPGKPCVAPDPTNYVGEDSNSTAAAALAFAALGDKARAAKAIAYLRSTQNTDGGFAYYLGGSSDVNSTAMAMLAFRANGIAPERVVKSGKHAISYLADNMLGCASASPGAFAYWGEASDKATVQALVALRPALPWKRASVIADYWPACPTPNTATSLWSAAAFHTVSTLTANNFAIPIPAAWGGGTDTSDTAWAALGLVGSDRDPAIAASTVSALRVAAKDYVLDKQGKPYPGRVALLLLVAKANGDAPQNFGGVDLLKLAKGSLGA